MTTDADTAAEEAARIDHAREVLLADLDSLHKLTAERADSVHALQWVIMKLIDSLRDELRQEWKKPCPRKRRRD